MTDAASDEHTRSESQSPREDAETKATREELKHTAISEKQEQRHHASSGARAATPEQVAAALGTKHHDMLKEQVGSPKKKRAHDQVDKDDEDRHMAIATSKDVDTDDDNSVSRDLASSGSGLDVPNGGDDAVTSRSDRAEPEKKRLRDKDAEAATNAGKAEAKKTDDNVSSTKDNKPVTTPSAFASSGFAKLATAASPFGSLGGGALTSKPSLFGSSSSSAASPFGALGSAATAAKPSPTLSSAPKLSFGGGASASPFASLPTTSTSKAFGSAFGGSTAAGVSSFGSATGGSGFGSALGSGPRLTSFAKPGSVFKSDKPARPFGAPESDAEDDGKDDGEAEADDDEENGGEAEGDEEAGNAKEIEERPKTGVEDKKRPKLQKVTVDDGEAGEATILQVRTRLYYLDKDQAGWKERGAGMLKINVPERCVEFAYDGSVIPASFDASTLAVEEKNEPENKGDDKAPTQGAATRSVAVPQRSVVRLIMRQDSTHKVILNTAVMAATEFQERQTLKSATILFIAFEGEDAKPVNIQIKMNVANAKTFMTTMEGIQKELRDN